jgi:cytoskeletal protein CcmA (bactofilin family)
MFKRKLDPKTVDTVIGEGTTFEGNVKSEASVNVEGEINGNLEGAGTVTIGQKGVVKSNISATEVIIAGTVHGNVRTSKNLTITATGHLHGDSNARSLTIDEGGVFLGTSKMEEIKAENLHTGSYIKDKQDNTPFNNHSN